MKANMNSADLARFDAYVTDVKEKINDVLEKILPLPDEKVDESRLFEAMRYSVFAGGKRLRPLLVFAVNEALGGREIRALRVAAAMEILHTYSLVHDDLPCMDDDDLRRGKPTCHVAFDEVTAVLAGDALQTLAFEVLAHEDTHNNPEIRAKLVHIFAIAAGATGMAGGQMIDMLSEGNLANMEQGALARLQRKKTGALFTACCEAAIVLNGATKIEEKHLISYARNIGLAFQMVDDVLDEEGDRDTLGKTTGKDVQSQKATFVTLLGVDAAKRQAEFLCQQAIENLAMFGEKADILRLLAQFIVKRHH